MISQLSLPTSRTGADWAKSCRHRRNQRKHFCERSNNAGAGNYDASASDYICLALTKISWMAQASGWSVFALAFIFVSNSIQNPGPAPTFSAINQAAHITRVPPCGGKKHKSSAFQLSSIVACARKLSLSSGNNCRVEIRSVLQPLDYQVARHASTVNPGAAQLHLVLHFSRLCFWSWFMKDIVVSSSKGEIYFRMLHFDILANLTEKDAVYHLPASVAATEVHLTITIPSFPTFSTSRCTYRLHFYHFQLFDSANAFNTSGRCRSSDVLIARQKNLSFQAGTKELQKGSTLMTNQRIFFPPGNRWTEKKR